MAKVVVLFEVGLEKMKQLPELQYWIWILTGKKALNCLIHRDE